MLISLKDFSSVTGIGKTPFHGLASLLMRVMKIEAFNSLVEQAEERTGVEFADYLLKTLGITVQLSDADIARVPREGPFIVVANHPYGAIESLALLSMLVKVRPDTMFMGNFLLKRVPALADYIIAVNPFESVKHSSSISGLKNTFRLIAEGAPVAIFPAGEVSSYHSKTNTITDKPWNPIVGKIIAKAKVPVVPVYFHGNNGLGFGLLRYIHPSLQTAMIPAELFNKRGRVLQIKVGKPVPAQEIAKYATANELLNGLRTATYALAKAD